MKVARMESPGMQISSYYDFPYFIYGLRNWLMYWMDRATQLVKHKVKFMTLEINNGFWLLTLPYPTNFFAPPIRLLK